jgi:glucosamine-6-phosphate deaminase
VLADHSELSERAAQLVLTALDTNPRLVLGLPTGGTPEGMYERIAATCRRETHCFAAATTFNLDEYVGLPPDHPGSYAAYMHRHLFRWIDLPPERRRIPDGTAARVRAERPGLDLEEALAEECRRFEAALAAAGGLDLAVLGLGGNGHLAFNEPGSPFDSRTRVVELAADTREANARYFPSLDEVPRRAITMGLGTLLDARCLLVLASGERKAAAIARLAGGEPSEEFPASCVHRHSAVTVLVDRAAAAAAPLPPPAAPG